MLQAQSDSGLGHFTVEQIKERDAINQEVIEKQRWQNDYYYNYLRNNQHNSQLNQKVNNAVSQAKSGIRIETYSNHEISTPNKRATHQQTQQIKKNNRDAEHRAWLEQRQQAKALTAERHRLEEQRKEIERQRKHDKILDSELQRTAVSAAQQQAKIEFRATEGRDFMYNYQPAGTEKIQSEYIPSQTTSTYNIASIISKSGSKPIALNGNEYYKASSNWDEMLLKTMKKIELNPVPFRDYGSNVWKELKGKLDDYQWQVLCYYLRSNNKQPVTEENEIGTFIKMKEVLPLSIGINDEGRYIFESEDGNRIFSVSKDGRHLQIATFEEHFWDDENLVKKIKEDGLNQYIKDSYKIEGKMNLKDLKEKSPEEIMTTLPRLKFQLKMMLADNSSGVTYQYFNLIPNNDLTPYQPHTIGVKGEISGGGKAEVSGKTGIISSAPNLGVTTAKTGVSMQVGRVKKRGEKYILCTGEIGAQISLKIDPTTLVTRNPIKANIKLAGFICKDITTPNE